MSKVTMVESSNAKSEINYGDLFKWEDSILFYCYSGLISLSNPKHIWSNSADVLELLKNYLRSGKIIRLPSGTKVVIEQE